MQKGDNLIMMRRSHRIASHWSTSATTTPVSSRVQRTGQILAMRWPKSGRPLATLLRCLLAAVYESAGS